MKAIFLLLILMVGVILTYSFFWNKAPSIHLYTFMGAPGSGKGTLAQEIVKSLGFTSISTGDLLRDAIAQKTAIGYAVEEYVTTGKLVPDEIVMTVIKSWLRHHIFEGKSIILDGFPRTASQAHEFIHMLHADFPSVQLIVVDLSISDDAIIRRLEDRVICEKCKTVYSRSLVGDTPLCELCEAFLVRRPDDASEVVRERLRIYKEHATDLKNVYHDHQVPMYEIEVEKKTPSHMYQAFTDILSRS